ncbi:hypothetical protein [Staphylococcus felis]|nr:hypothetical protein [Staphylococcus felis]
MNNPLPGDKEVTGTGEPVTTVDLTYTNVKMVTSKVVEKGISSVSVLPT